MAANNTLGRNIVFKIYNADGTEFNGLVLRKATYESVVMSLGDKITGDVYYKDNTLAVTMQEYIEYKQNPDDENELPVRFVLVNPPTIIREGMVSDNGDLKGMTKYSFTFYHPMCLLGNFPFSDIAVSSDQQKYLSQNKTFSWIGNLTDYVAKLNKNLAGTEWVCEIGDTVTSDVYNKLSDVLSFDKQSIADALKTGYDTWKVPYIIDVIQSTDSRYAQGKRFLVRYGLPSEEILDGNSDPFVFEFGKGVGLKNNSRTPKNNKIITRIAGYGSEDNIPYGYPQIVWTGNQSWKYTINNNPNAANSYPIYDGIVNGQLVKLIKHPFTRKHLMPSIYAETVNKKVNPNATGYDPTIEIKDYYDAVSSGGYVYPNPININAPSYEIHEFEEIKPELGQASIVGVSAYDTKEEKYVTLNDCLELLGDYYSESTNQTEKNQLADLIEALVEGTADSESGVDGTYTYEWSVTLDAYFAYVKYKSNILDFAYTVKISQQTPAPTWDDTMDDDGNYVQSYFKLTLPQLSFDLYACAAITQEMSINMRSGACIGCTFTVQVDWDDYKKNFYDENGNFDPVIGQGHPRNGDKYPNSSTEQITIIVQKDNNTFGTLMPNIYQVPQANDKFVILGISLPLSYVSSAESRLDDEMIQYMKDNNVYHYEYPLKFDEHFLATHTDILAQLKCNVKVNFKYNGETITLYVKQIAIKYGQATLPQYDITLTDDVEVVLNPIGKTVETFRTMLEKQGVDLDALDAHYDERYNARFLSKMDDDTAAGFVRLLRGLQVGERFVTGLLGEGGVFRTDDDGKTYLEVDKMYVRVKAYFDEVEIRKYMHSSGNRIASNAGIKCSRVEYIDDNGDVTQDASLAVKYRCYFRAADNGDAVTNDFVVGDLAFCEESNAQVAQGVSQHGYWRAVVGKNSTLTESGEGWIDLSATDCRDDSDIPIAQDDIVQLGNKTDTTRQGAIVEYVSGSDSPSYQIYQGINTYSLSNKNYVSMGYSSSTGRAYLNVFGDFRFGSSSDNGSFIKYDANTGLLDIKARINASSPVVDGSTTYNSMKSFVEANSSDWTQQQINALIHDVTDPIQSQIDGAIDTWFYDYMPVATDASGAPANRVPLTNKEPYKTWYETDGGGTAGEVTTERDKHLGDIFYDNSSGYAFRFSFDETNQVFQWVEITDSAVIKALQDAQKAQDTADNKRRVFLTTPTPPYDEGDLWVNVSGTFTKRDGTTVVTYADELLKCKQGCGVPRTPSGGSEITTFNIEDWDIASNYAHTFDYLSNVLQGSNTIINGGLVMTTLIGMRDTAATPNVWAGLSGLYQNDEVGTIASTYKYMGHGTASWFGGDMHDFECLTDEEKLTLRYAKTLFRFDGSGYLANGNISWDDQGAVTIQGVTIDATTLQQNGVGVVTSTELGGYLPLTGGTLSGVLSSTVADGIAPFSILSTTRVANLNADLLDGYHGSDFTRRFTFDLSSTTNYNRIVFAFCKLTAASTSTNYSHSFGIYSAYRKAGTGSYFWGLIDFRSLYSGAQAYRAIIYSPVRNFSTTLDDTTGIRPCRFKYNDVWYGGLEVYGGNLQIEHHYLIGNSTLTPFWVAYYKQNDGTVLNQEVYDSINFTGGLTDNSDLILSSYIQIGNVRIEYDSTNNALKVVKSDGSTAANFYATGSVSALGYASGGGGGGGGASALSELVDVELSSPEEGQVLTYYNDKWRNMNLPSIDMSDVWTALGDNTTTQQIAGSHLTTALSNYVLKTDLVTTTTNGLMSADDKKYLSYITPILKGSANSSATAQYTFFARTPIANTSRGPNLIALVHGLGYYYTGQFSGTYIVEMRSNQGTPVMQATMLSPKGTSGTVTFGYYNNTDDGYVYFGVYTSTRHLSICVEPLYNYNNTIMESLSTPVVLTSAPTGWTTVETRTYADSSLFLPLSGGTMTGNIIMPSTAIAIRGADETGGALIMWDGTRTIIGSAGASTTIATHIRSITGHATIGTSTTASYTIWDSGNDGADSGLDADLLDGQHGSYYGTAASITTLEGYFTSGVANSAAILATARTLWGQSFDGSANVTGTITVGAGDIIMNNNRYLYWKNTSGTSIDALRMTSSNNLALGNGMLGKSKITYVIGDTVVLRTASGVNSLSVLSSGNVGIGNSSPTYKLDVNGTGHFANNLTVDGSSTYINGMIQNVTTIELNSTGLLSGYGGFIDFHYNGSSANYTSRIAEYSSGYLSFDAHTVTNGNSYINGAIYERKNYFLMNTESSGRGLMIEGYAMANNILAATFGFHVAGDSVSWVGDNFPLQIFQDTTNVANRGIQIGEARLIWDSMNNALKIVKSDGTAGNFYATGGISALGLNSIVSESVTIDLLPSQSYQYQLGNTSKIWNYLHVKEIDLKDSSYWCYIYLQSDGLNINCYDGLYFSGYNDIQFYTTGSFIVNTKLAVNTSSVSSYAFYVSGNSYFTGSISAQTVTQRSDMRTKDVVGNLSLKVESIANAPSFRYTFKDGDNRVLVGTSAQYWQAILPQTVFSDESGLLSLDYGVTALASVISVARELTEHERRIAKLEAENLALQAEIKNLKAA